MGWEDGTFGPILPGPDQIRDYIDLAVFGLIIYGGGFIALPTLGWWAGHQPRRWLTVVVCVVGLPVQAMLGVYAFLMVPVIVVTALVQVPVLGYGLWWAYGRTSAGVRSLPPKGSSSARR